jgi:hypothetical protein
MALPLVVIPVMRNQGRERLQTLANSIGRQGIKTVWT